MNDGHQQGLEVDVDGDPQVDVVVDDELVVADRGVDVRELGDGVDGRPSDERQIGEADALLGLERVLVGLAHLLDTLEVRLHAHQRVG